MEIRKSKMGKKVIRSPRGAADSGDFGKSGRLAGSQPIVLRTIEDEASFEARYPEDSQGGEFRMLEPGMPSHFGVGGEQGEGFMRCQEKAVANFGTRFRGQVIGLIV